MRRAVAVLLASAALLIGTTPASAEPPVPVDLLDRPLAVIGSADVRFRYDAPTDTVEVHLDGDVSGGTRQVGLWRLLIAGTRGTTPYTYTWESSAFTITDHVVRVARAATSGGFVVRWGYTAAGSYVTAEQEHVFLWSPTTSNQTAGTGVTR